MRSFGEHQERGNTLLLLLADRDLLVGEEVGDVLLHRREGLFLRHGIPTQRAKFVEESSARWNRLTQ